MSFNKLVMSSLSLLGVIGYAVTHEPAYALYSIVCALFVIAFCLDDIEIPRGKRK